MHLNSLKFSEYFNQQKFEFEFFLILNNLEDKLK